MKNYTRAYALIFALVFISSILENPLHVSYGVVALQAIIEAGAVTLMAYLLLAIKRRYS